MPEQTSTTTVQTRRSYNPLLLLIILLLLLLLGFVLSKWMLEQCLAGLTPPAETTTAQVLGITNLDVSSDLDQAQGGGVVNFTVTGDHDEPLDNALIVFDTTGMGTIQSAPVGSGLCVKVSDTQATCTGVNLLTNQALSYVVPVAVDTACGLLGTDRVGLDVTINQTGVEDATAEGDVGCSGAGSSSTSAGTSTSTGATTTRPSSGGTTTTSDTSVSGNDDNNANSAKVYGDQVAACHTNANNLLLLAIGIPLLLLLVIYAIAEMNNRNRRTTN